MKKNLNKDIQKFKTISGIELKNVYKPADGVLNDHYNEKLGAPGEYPFTRGIQPDMYRGKLWTMRQYAGYGTAAETNSRFKYLHDHGQTGFSVAFDLPTQMGYDSDHKMAMGEVGRVGVAVDSVDDMMRLFDGLPLGEISTSMTINATSPVLFSMYAVVAKSQGTGMDKLRGTVQNDILKEYSSRGTYIFPPEPSLRLTIDLIEFCARNIPQWNPISISGYHMREAGATAVQEVAFTLADAIEYVEACLKRGLGIDDFAPRLSFFFACHNDFLEEVAKFRAVRRMWARIVKERFKAKNQRSMMLRFHTQTAGCSLTAQQPLNNAIRVAIQALAAVIGGTQSLHTNSYDEALALPTAEAVRLALRTQQIIAEESGVANTVDPVGGAYAIEALTNRIEDESRRELEKVENMGGAAKAIEKGYIQQSIADSAYKYQQAVERGERSVVGLNAYKMDEEITFELLKVNPEIEQKQIARLKKLKATRNNSELKSSLNRIRKTAESSKNLMPSILDAVGARATVGEISDVLRIVFGTYKG